MYSSIIFVASALVVVIAITALEYARREVNRKRREYRMTQALRRGLSKTEGTQGGPRVIPWQSCETTTARFV